MTKIFTATVVLILAAFAGVNLHAQTADGSQDASGQMITDLSGVWEAPYDLTPGGVPRTDLCGESACQQLMKKGRPPLETTLEEPEMLPWVAEKYKASRDGESPEPRPGVNPYFSACTTLSPSALMVTFFISVEVRQFPDMVLLLFGGIAGESDHAVRRIYVDGRGHPSNLESSWMGHSVGHYEGDTLVVDTVGIESLDGNRWVDRLGHLQTDALRLTERFRRADAKTLEYEVTVHDPKAYKNSWRMKFARELAQPGVRFWDDAICEELLRMGTHYGSAVR